jgi:uncharacterized tellurite resistance protein B-like protein
MSSAAKHPATKLPLSERIDYLVVVASMAAADGEIAGAEYEKLREFCKALELGPAEIGQVMAAVEEPDTVRIREVTGRLRSSQLRFTLMTDLLFMALADEKFVEAERREIRALADALNLTDPQLAALEKYVQAVLKAGKADGVGAEDFKKLGGDVAASLAATGIPIAAVAVSGTVFGLSAAGITSGLAALGLGLGMASGLGVAVAIGVGSFFSVRWLYRRVVGA